MPDPVVMLPELEEERDFLFDIRTGYAVLDKEPGHFDNHPYGEGDPEIFVVVRAKRRDIPAQWSAPDSEGVRNRIRKLDLKQAHKDFAPANRIKSGLLSNVYKVKATFVAGDDADFKAEIAKYDTKQNAVRTVGTGYTFATIQASINAGASGDVSAVYGNGATPLVSGQYPESITDNGLDGYQLLGMLDDHGVSVNPAAGNGFTLTRSAWLLDNLDFDGNGLNYGVRISGGLFSTIRNCTSHGWTYGFGVFVSFSNRFENCAGWSNGNDAFYSHTNVYGDWVHCSAFNNTRDGFHANNAGFGNPRGCLSGGNGNVDFLNCQANRSAWNVSEDLTAPGSGVRTGFNMANIVNNWQLAAAGENGANIDGGPLLGEDGLHNPRERDTLIFYAGAHDPYVPAAATVTCLGIIDAAPAAQGSIWIRFYEMCISGNADPYRYDVHVKRFDNGVLTEAEINAGTYYARSFYADELNGCGGDGSPGGSGGLPGVLQALIAFEAPEDITPSVIPNDENMHLFTNRQYWIAVRAVAIDSGNVIYEDDNAEVALSYSSGHQGELWTQIIGWPCLELCAGNPTQNVNVVGVPNLNIDSIPDVTIADWPLLNVELPPIDAILRAGDEAGVVSPQGG